MTPALSVLSPGAVCVPAEADPRHAAPLQSEGSTRVCGLGVHLGPPCHVVPRVSGLVGGWGCIPVGLSVRTLCP